MSTSVILFLRALVALRIFDSCYMIWSLKIHYLITGVIYRWDDESNGEIYTDKPMDSEENSDNIGLYVVENGREYPLIPLSERKSLFEQYKQAIVLPDFSAMSSNLGSSKTRQKSKSHMNLTSSDLIKSSNTPYILEEQAILSSIDVVAKVKPKFH